MKISIFGVCSTIQMILLTALKGTHIGTDHLGNKYYKCAPRKGTQMDRRWIMYADKADASLVPPEWHGWLHHQTDIMPEKVSKYRQPWQKLLQPNLSKVDGYTPWQPPQ